MSGIFATAGLPSTSSATVTSIVGSATAVTRNHRSPSRPAAVHCTSTTSPTRMSRYTPSRLRMVGAADSLTAVTPLRRLSPARFVGRRSLTPASGRPGAEVDAGIEIEVDPPVAEGVGRRLRRGDDARLPGVGGRGIGLDEREIALGPLRRAGAVEPERAGRRPGAAGAVHGARPRGLDIPAAPQRVDDQLAGDLEHLRRLVAERGGAEGGARGQRQRGAAVGEQRELDDARHRGARPIAEPRHQVPNRLLAPRRAQVALVGVHLVVERQDVGDVGPHLEEHDAEVLRPGAAPSPELGSVLGGARRVQHRLAEPREARDLAIDPREARRDVERRRVDDPVAGAAHAPPSIVKVTAPRSG